MSFLTLFSAPKAFTDPATARSQRNAIQSWKRLVDTDVLLLGAEDGLAQAAREIGVKYIPNVALNPNGVPLISSMFRLARDAGESRLLCIINADIILTSDFVEAAQNVDLLGSSAELANGYVLLSQRWDVDVPAALDFTDRWEARLRKTAHEQGRLHRPTGSDFFLFPRQCYSDVPDFAIGRAGWDNWMIYQARRQGWAVVDGTPSMFIVHQNHDYRHLPGARPHYDHPDTHVNTRLAGGQAATRYTILDATHVLIDGNLRRPAMTVPRFMRSIELLLRRLLFLLPAKVVENIARPRWWKRRMKKLLGKTNS